MKNSRLLSALVLMALVASLLGSALPAAAAGTATLTVNIVNTNQGATVTVPILVQNDGYPMRAYQVDVNFDPSRLQAQSITDAGFLTTAGHGTSQIPGSTPTIDNVGGHITGLSYTLVGGAGYGAVTTGTPATLANIVFTVPSGAPNGKANISLVNVLLADVNAAAFSTVNINSKWVQVGPGPNLGMSIGFTPHGTGSTFDANVIVTNSGGSASDPDTLNVTLSNALPATASFTVPSLAVNGSQTFSITNVALNTGAQNSVVQATLVNVNVVKSATYSPVSSNGTTPVDATFGAFLKITPDSAVSFGQLALGDNFKGGNLNVQSNTNYEVDVFDNGTTAWHMTEWNGSAFLTNKLADSMHIISSQSNDVTAGTPAKFVTGGVAGQSGDAGQNFGVSYKQTLHYGDPLLPSGETYHLVLTFNGYVTM